jgi:hypothetical protein
MALIKCIECNKEFSNKAVSCPNCGCPTSYSNMENDINNLKQDMTKNEELISTENVNGLLSVQQDEKHHIENLTIAKKPLYKRIILFYLIVLIISSLVYIPFELHLVNMNGSFIDIAKDDIEYFNINNIPSESKTVSYKPAGKTDFEYCKYEYGLMADNYIIRFVLITLLFAIIIVYYHNKYKKKQSDDAIKKDIKEDLIQKELDNALKENNKQNMKEERVKTKLKEEELILFDIENYYKGIGFSDYDAKKTAEDIYLTCKKECEEEQTSTYSKIGRGVFELAKSDKYIKECIELARANGVNDNEIEAWWSLSDIRRKVTLKLNEQAKLAAFIQYMQDGMLENEAANKVKRYYAIYGYVENNGDKQRPIPPELKVKVDDYIKMMSSSELMRDSFKIYLDKYNNFNKLVREKWLERSDK